MRGAFVFTSLAICIFSAPGVLAVDPTAPAPRLSYCQSLLELTPAQLGGLRPEFLAAHNTEYDYELPPLEPRNQNQFDSCATYCAVADLARLIRKAQGRDIPPSERYLILRALELNIADAFANPRVVVQGGGRVHEVLALTQRVGLVPDSVFVPRVPFDLAPHNVRMLEFINARIEKYHLQAASASSLARIGLLKRAREDVQALLAVYTGPVPSETFPFEFEGKSYTPLSFAREMIPGFDRLKLKILYPENPLLPPELSAQIYDPESYKPAGEVNVASGSSRTVEKQWLPIDEIEKQLIEAFKEGKTVLLAYESHRTFMDIGTGILSISGFYTPEGYQPSPANYRGNTGRLGGGHAVEVVGIDLDANGRLIKLKLRNSWGMSGDRGYLHMYVDYFRAYMQMVFFGDSAFH